MHPWPSCNRRTRNAVSMYEYENTFLKAADPAKLLLLNKNDG